MAVFFLKHTIYSNMQFLRAYLAWKGFSNYLSILKNPFQRIRFLQYSCADYKSGYCLFFPRMRQSYWKCTFSFQQECRFCFLFFYLLRNLFSVKWFVFRKIIWPRIYNPLTSYRIDFNPYFRISVKRSFIILDCERFYITVWRINI